MYILLDFREESFWIMDDVVGVKAGVKKPSLTCRGDLLLPHASAHAIIFQRCLISVNLLS